MRSDLSCLRTNLVTLVVAFVVVLLAGPVQASGQKSDSVVSFSDVSDAQRCYLAARNAMILGSADYDDIHVCTRAIRVQNLSKLDLARTHINRGVLRRKVQNSKGALWDYYRARRIMGDYPALNINIGNVSYMRHQYATAIRFYDKALDQQHAANYMALVNRGLANERIGEFDAAISDYRAALQAKPGQRIAAERLDMLTNRHASFEPVDESELLAVINW